MTSEISRKITERGIESFGRHYSPNRAYCTDNNDPENMGRIKVLCPNIWGNIAFDNWVHSFGIQCGPDSGMIQLPQIGDVVTILFEDGNTLFPVWTYGWWTQNGFPKEAQGRASEVSIWKTHAGQMILIDDKQGSIKVVNGNGDNILIEKDKIKLDAKNIILSEAAQSAVLGDKLESFLSKLIDTIALATTIDGKPLNTVYVQTLLKPLKLEAKKILSQKVKLG